MSPRGVELSEMHCDAIRSRGSLITYLPIDSSGRRYLVLVATCCVPDPLHDQDCLFDGHVPRVGSFTNKGHIRRDKRMSEPLHINPVWKIFVSRSFRFRYGGSRGGLGYKFLIVTVRSLH